MKFAYDKKIVLMADEVYQENIYQDERPFVSARKVMYDMGEPYASGVEMLSFHTVSKVSMRGQPCMVSSCDQIATISYIAHQVCQFRVMSLAVVLYKVV